MHTIIIHFIIKCMRLLCILPHAYNMDLWGIEVKKETSRHTIDGKGANV